MDFSSIKAVLIRKVLEDTGMNNCNGLPTPTKVDSPPGIYDNGSEANRYLTKSYDSVICNSQGFK